jgi:hypothetical protein
MSSPRSAKREYVSVNLTKSVTKLPMQSGLRAGQVQPIGRALQVEPIGGSPAIVDPIGGFHFQVTPV